MAKLASNLDLYTIRGRIVVQETGVGIPNLLVRAFDLDRIPAKETTSEGIDTDNDLPKQLTLILNPFIEACTGYLIALSDSLGSVLTDGTGSFLIQYDSTDFNVYKEKELRPELVLRIEKPIVVTEKVLELQNNVLHVTLPIRLKAGKTESYFLKIPKSILDQHQIPYSDPVPDLEIDTRARIWDKIKENGALSRTSALNLKTRINSVLQNFRYTPKKWRIRINDHWLLPTEDLKTKQTGIRENYFAELPALAGRANRRVILHLSEEELELFGLRYGEGGIDGRVPAAQVLDFIRTFAGKSSLEFKKPVVDYCAQTKRIRDLFDDFIRVCAPSGNDDDGQPDTPDSGSIPNAELLDRKLNQLLRNLSSPEEELRYGVERNGEIIATITTPSPTDVTSFHDFHELHIAFEDIWTEAVDKDTRAFINRVYGELVKYKNRVSGVEEVPVVSDLSDMTDLYHDILALEEIMEEVEPAEAEIAAVATPCPQEVKSMIPEISDREWTDLEQTDRTQLVSLAAEWVNKNGHRNWLLSPDGYAARWFAPGSNLGEAEITLGEMNGIKSRAQALLTAAKERLRHQSAEPAPKPDRPATSASQRLARLMSELDKRRAEPHKFDLFAPDSVNYAMMLTYRQKWVPGNYQVGDLVKTIPLAPKEVRRYSTKTVVKKTRSQKEIEDSQSSRSTESASTSRAEAEITRQARNKTAFEQTASGTLSVGIFQGQFGTRFGMEAEKSSNDTKKNFRESVLKANEEQKMQKRLEVEINASEEVEAVHSGEIMNPNDEITVTYLFYELQRQFELSERLYRMSPVVLVANDVPAPDEIDVDWLIAHDWILRRVILDQSFLPALQYATTGIAGDEIALQNQFQNLVRQVNLVEALTSQAKLKSTLAEQAFQELKRVMSMANNVGDAERMKEIGLAMVFGPFSLAGSGDDQSAEKREEVAKLAYEKEGKDRQEITAKLSREMTALNEILDKYTNALRDHFDRQTAITRALIHIKENILYYMQAIWDYEPADQRYFRLHNIEVPWIELDTSGPGIHVTGRRADSPDARRFSSRASERYEVEFALPATSLRTVDKKLSEVANLDDLLGYKGNYMIFPAREPNYLHLLMMQDYLDPATGGLRDPDEFDNYSSAELLKFACCLQQNDPERFSAMEETLLNWLQRRSETPRKESELVVVPTGSLYMEALPGKHPVLEDFKLVHRALDVKKVQAEVRGIELENLRFGSRITGNILGDPNVDRYTVIEGRADAVITPPES